MSATLARWTHVAPASWSRASWSNSSIPTARRRCLQRAAACGVTSIRRAATGRCNPCRRRSPHGRRFTKRCASPFPRSAITWVPLFVGVNDPGNGQAVSAEIEGHGHIKADLLVQHQRQAMLTKHALSAAGLPVMPNPSHIVPVLVGDPELCKRATDMLLDRHAIYIQPINYPTVARGGERLRITPSPLHTDAHIAHLVESMADVWRTLGLPFVEPAKILEFKRESDARCTFPEFKRAAE